MPFYILCAQVTKSDAGTYTHSAVTGYRTAPTPEAAKGDFIDMVFREKPGFAIYEITIMPVPPNHLEEALQTYKQ
jgi:hypothetical protein